jgi:putative SOS response-associated peptidase YedK
MVYEPASDPRHFKQLFQLDCAIPASPVRPGDQGLFIRLPRGERKQEAETVGFEASTGRWGLIPLFAATRDYPDTFEAPAETAPIVRNFLQPWKRGHRCVVLANALFRRGAQNTATVRVARADGMPLALAGLWNGWRSPEGDCVESFALLTLPSLECPGERRVVFLREGWLVDWLQCPVEEAAAYLRPYDLDKLARVEVPDFMT